MDAELREYLDDMAAMIARQFEILGDRIIRLDERMGALEERMGALEGRMGTLEERMGALETRPSCASSSSKRA